MYQYSRAIFRDLAGHVAPDGDVAARRRAVLAACESACVRLARDRHYFARPARSLFRDVRMYFPISRQLRVHQVIDHHMRLAAEYVDGELAAGRTPEGAQIPCPAMTRKGQPCQREPFGASKYCPSHRHLEEPRRVA